MFDAGGRDLLDSAYFSVTGESADVPAAATEDAMAAVIRRSSCQEGASSGVLGRGLGLIHLNPMCGHDINSPGDAGDAGSTYPASRLASICLVLWPPPANVGQAPGC
jgi:hypothetical protein